VGNLEARLRNDAFLTKAPPAVVAKERERLATLSDKLARLVQCLSNDWTIRAL